MKKIIFVILILASFLSKGQAPISNGATSVTNVWYRLRGGLTFGVPIAADTTLNGGLDSLGSMMYKRGVGFFGRNNATGVKIWRQFAMADTLNGFVTIATNQTLTGRKDWTTPQTFSDSLYNSKVFLNSGDSNYSKANQFLRVGRLDSFSATNSNVFRTKIYSINSGVSANKFLPSTVLVRQLMELTGADTLNILNRFLNGGAPLVVYNFFTKNSASDTVEVTNGSPKNSEAYYSLGLRSIAAGLSVTQDNLSNDTLVKWNMDVPISAIATEAKITKRGYLASFNDLLIGSTNVISNDTATSSTFHIKERIGLNILTLANSSTDTSYAIKQWGTTDSVIFNSANFRTPNIPSGAPSVLIGMDSNGNWIKVDTTGGGGGGGISGPMTGTLPIIVSNPTISPNISIANALADGTTKGASTYVANDFNSTTGLISIDYTNGQAASTSTKGFLTNTDWNIFNGKQATITGAITNYVTSNATASKALATDAGGKIITVGTSRNELGFVQGVTSSIQTQLNAKLSTTLTSAHLLVGNGSNVATDIALSGDATLANTGALTLANTAVTPGTYLNANITVDSKGRVTAAANGSDTTGGGSVTQVNGDFPIRVVNNLDSPRVSVATATVISRGVVQPFASDFNMTDSTLTIDYTNGQAATTSQPGFLSATNWNTFNNKQNTITGGASSIATANLTASKALVSDPSGKVAISAVSTNELGYLVGTTTSVQTQLNDRALVATTITAGTGLSGGGDLSTNRTINLANTAVVAGSYTNTNITVDAQGRITAAANGSGGGGSGTVTNFIFTNGGGFTGTVSTSTTTPTLSLVLQNAAADGTTKGQSTFTAADFNATTGLISIDYINGQAASGTLKGFLSATDWTTFNNKQATITGAITPYTTSNASPSLAIVSNGSGKLTTSVTTAAEIAFVSGVTSNIQAQINAIAPAANKAFQALSLSGANINWVYTAGYNASYTLGANRNIVISSDADGDYGTLLITQGGGGGFYLEVPHTDFLQDGINVVGQPFRIDLPGAVGSRAIVTWVNRGGVRYWTMGYYHQ